jgi:hypothetical protein
MTTKRFWRVEEIEGYEYSCQVGEEIDVMPGDEDTNFFILLRMTDGQLVRFAPGSVKPLVLSEEDDDLEMGRILH